MIKRHCTQEGKDQCNERRKSSLLIDTSKSDSCSERVEIIENALIPDNDLLIPTPPWLLIDF